MGGFDMDLAPPKDRYYLIYITLMTHGVGTLVAWNMFITAKDYFVEYKLANAPEYAEHYLAYVGWASQLPNVLFNWLNVFINFSGHLTTRIVWSLCMEVVIFIFTIALAMLDSSDWPAMFFWLTMISVLLLNSFNAIFQNSVYGVAARLPPKYTGATIVGCNICGTLVVFLEWGSELFGSERTSAIYYFIAGTVVLIVCFDTYLALPLNRFYRYHDSLQHRGLHHNPALVALGTRVRQRPPYRALLKQIWVQLYNIFVNFFVTLAVFPAVHSEIKPVTEGFLGEDFMRITCFLTFNLMAMIGNITAMLRQWPNRKWLCVFATIRFLFIPFFLNCNYKPITRESPVLIDNDYVYWAGAALLGWSSGHGSSLGMMYVSSNVAPEHASTAGMLGSAMLVTGILCGLVFTYLCPMLV